jgi:hypothetical protein
MNNLELLAISWMIGPLALHLDNFTSHRGHEISYDGHKISTAIHFHLGYGEAIFYVCVGDPFDLALKVGEHTRYL